MPELSENTSKSGPEPSCADRQTWLSISRLGIASGVIRNMAHPSAAFEKRCTAPTTGVTTCRASFDLLTAPARPLRHPQDVKRPVYTCKPTNTFSAAPGPQGEEAGLALNLRLSATLSKARLDVPGTRTRPFLLCCNSLTPFASHSGVYHCWDEVEVGSGPILRSIG